MIHSCSPRHHIICCAAEAVGSCPSAGEPSGRLCGVSIPREGEIAERARETVPHSYLGSARKWNGNLLKLAKGFRNVMSVVGRTKIQVVSSWLYALFLRTAERTALSPTSSSLTTMLNAMATKEVCLPRFCHVCMCIFDELYLSGRGALFPGHCRQQQQQQRQQQ
ncbi:hypothetical protein DINM_002672 [Dirofilaria immitis]|nr:hypothetical protein [Dirofilaria immitis]